jgi:hypothetical protein
MNPGPVDGVTVVLERTTHMYAPLRDWTSSTAPVTV